MCAYKNFALRSSSRPRPFRPRSISSVNHRFSEAWNECWNWQPSSIERLRRFIIDTMWIRGISRVLPTRISTKRTFDNTCRLYHCNSFVNTYYTCLISNCNIVNQQYVFHNYIRLFNEIRSVRWHLYKSRLEIIEDADCTNFTDDLNVKVNNFNGVACIFFLYVKNCNSKYDEIAIMVTRAVMFTSTFSHLSCFALKVRTRANVT